MIKVFTEYEGRYQNGSTHDTIEVDSLRRRSINLFSIILLHLCLDHLRDLWYIFAWSQGGGSTTWSRVLVLINKSGAYKASLRKKRHLEATVTFI